MADRSYLGQSGLPRGLANNNPGNEEISSSAWLGKIPVKYNADGSVDTSGPLGTYNTDGTFEQFTSLWPGLRVEGSQILYDVNNGLNTLTLLINSYAPPSENDTQSYINTIASATGIDPNEQLVLTEPVLAAIMRVQIEVEQGKAAADQYITDDDISSSIAELPQRYLTEIGEYLKKN